MAIRQDRGKPSLLITPRTYTTLQKAISHVKKDEERKGSVGTIAAKYVETLQRSNEQLVKISALLSPADIGNFEFYDKVRIKNREYRVNKIDYKPGALTKLELILIP